MNTILEAVETTLATTPDALAVADENERLTYRELDRRSQAVAAHLVRRGVGRGAVVAVVLPRSAGAIVALLGAWRAGAGYLTIDRDSPAARIEKMIADSGARAVIAEDARFGALGVELATALAETADLPAIVPAPADLAYVIYTSGSTGTPKGAALEHRSLLAFHRCYGPLIAPGPTTRSAQFTNLAFDAHAWEIWPALAVGASVHVVPPGVRSDPEALARWMASEAITSSFLPTPVGEHFLNVRELPPTLAMLALGGDVLHAVPPYPGPMRTVNVYGPTETTIVCVTQTVPPGTVMPAIGHAAAEARIHIVDDALEAVTPGAIGEICIGGPFVGRGYLNRPGLTASVFVPDPFSDVPGARLYRSGDLGRVRDDGMIECLGRRDFQLKIRGQRVEIGEIEAVLARHPGVELGVVVAHVDPAGTKRLAAYAKLRSAVGVEELRAHLARELPSFMVPASILAVDAFPLTPNGKIDRRALPPPVFAADGEEAPFVAPRDEREAAIARVLAEALGIPRLGIDQDIFLAGADSLFAMRAAARLRRDVHPAIGARMLFASPTVAALARDIAALPDATGTTIDALQARTGPAPLSRLQERLWFLEKLEPGSSAYLIATATRLRGKLDPDALERAFVEVVRRHEALRTTFEEKDGRVLQHVQAKPALRLERRDLRRVPGSEQGRVVKEQVQRQFTARFDLKKGPPIRAALVRLADEEHVLAIAMHHIVSDGWSLGLIASELATLYGAFARGAPSPLPELAFHYGDYAAWDRARPDVDDQLAFWRAHLADAPPALTFPADRARPPTQRHRGAHVAGALGAELTGGLRRMGHAHRATLYMVLLAGFSAVLGRLAGQRSVVVATPTVQRRLPETDAMVGFFMNTLALHVPLDGDPTFAELLGRAREASLGAYANQDVPFERIVQELNPARDPSRSPLAQASLNLLNIPSIEIALEGLASETLDDSVVGSKFDFTLYVVEEQGGLVLDLLYDPDLFDRSRMERFLRKLESFLAHAAAAPEKRVDAIPLVLEDERALLPVPGAPLPASAVTPLPASFEDAAARFGDRLALADANRTWTYAELASDTNRLAQHLVASGVARGHVVAVRAERHAHLVLGLVAILKAGAAFLILDAEYPAARLAVQAAHATAPVWLDASEAPVPDELATLGARVSLMEAAWADAPATSPGVVVTALDRAYVAFTSGTLGQPKAIAGTHGPLAHFVAWHAATHGLDETDRFAALSGLAHDPFLRDALLPLALGAAVIVPPADVRLEPKALTAWLDGAEITVAHLTPSLGEVVAHARPGSLRRLRLAAFGGELLRPELVRTMKQIAPGAAFVNFYGATETPQAIASCRATGGETASVPIGRGIEGVQLLVLNHGDALAGVDEEGEIVVRTPWLAEGYLGAPTGGFGTSPFTRASDDRIYRTGDRGRYLPDGNVQLLGRQDDQVKVRGFRVELAEVTAALAALEGVARAAVVFVDGSLLGYAASTRDAGELRNELRAVLPSYMIPRAIVTLAELPLTPNGKLDRRALPAVEPPADAGNGTDLAEDDEVEAAVVEVWKDVLGITSMRRSDNFFDLGGHSLLATQVALRLGEALGVNVTVRMIFEAPTVAELAERLTSLLIETASPEALAAAMEGMGEPAGG